jgi:hypothetical protein
MIAYLSNFFVAIPASFSLPMMEITLLLILLTSISFLLIVKRESFFLPNIPVIKDHWLLGIQNFIDAKKMRNILTTRGRDGLVQFNFMGHKILVIGDKQVAKIALKEINGKGFFHNPTPSFVTSGIFSFDTGPEWQQRRSAFRKAFSMSALRRHTSSVVRLNEKLRTVLDRAAENLEVIKIDNIFSQLTVGVICELAFELDIKVFESTSNSLNIDDVMARFFEVTLPPFPSHPHLSLVLLGPEASLCAVSLRLPDLPIQDLQRSSRYFREHHGDDLRPHEVSAHRSHDRRLSSDCHP